MKAPVINPVPMAKTLAEQKADFTAEGAPPPGTVSTPAPVTAPAPGQPAPIQRPARATITLKRAVARASR